MLDKLECFDDAMISGGKESQGRRGRMRGGCPRQACMLCTCNGHNFTGLQLPEFFTTTNLHNKFLGEMRDEILLLFFSSLWALSEPLASAVRVPHNSNLQILFSSKSVRSKPPPTNCIGGCCICCQQKRFWWISITFSSILGGFLFTSPPAFVRVCSLFASPRMTFLFWLATEKHQSDSDVFEIGSNFWPSGALCKL